METLQPSSKRKLYFVVGALLLGMVALSVLANNQPLGAATIKSSEKIKPDALSMMESVFVGEPSREELQAKMDQLLSTYHMESTEENYTKVGSMLVSLRKNSKVSVMELADCIIDSHEKTVNQDLAAT